MKHDDQNVVCVIEADNLIVICFEKEFLWVFLREGCVIKPSMCKLARFQEMYNTSCQWPKGLLTLKLFPSCDRSCHISNVNHLKVNWFFPYKLEWLSVQCPKRKHMCFYLRVLFQPRRRRWKVYPCGVVINTVIVVVYVQHKVNRTGPTAFVNGLQDNVQWTWTQGPSAVEELFAAWIMHHSCCWFVWFRDMLLFSVMTCFYFLF